MIGDSTAAQLNTTRSLGDCSICLSEKVLEDSSTLIKIEPCQHTYHQPCVQPWLESEAQNSRTCPECRTPTTTASKLTKIGATPAEDEVATPPVLDLTNLPPVVRPQVLMTRARHADTSARTIFPYALGRIMASGISGMIGTKIVANHNPYASSLLSGFQTAAGSVFTSLPNAILFSGSYYAANTNNSQVAKLPLLIHTLAQVGIDSANSALGSKLMTYAGQPSIATNAAIGATGCAVILGSVAFLTGAVISGKAIATQVNNRNGNAQPTENTEPSVELASVSRDTSAV